MYTFIFYLTNNVAFFKSQIYLPSYPAPLASEITLTCRWFIDFSCKSPSVLTCSNIINFALFLVGCFDIRFQLS